MNTEKIPDEKVMSDFYQKIRKKFDRSNANELSAPDDESVFRKFLVFMFIFPDIVHLLIKLLFDKSVPAENKGALIASAVYLVSPIDIIPDVVPVYGYVDDFIVIVMALNKFMDSSDPNIKLAIEKHWAGDRDIYELVKHIMEIFESTVEFIPKKLLTVINQTLKPVGIKNS